MELVLILLKIALFIWVLLLLVMLPVYFIRKKKRPHDEKNTVRSLLIKSLIASVIFTLISCSGLIAMYIDEQNGIYRR